MARWTDAQAKAIYEPSGEGNILVSAAAGSGKTAVLVERIVNLIVREVNPISIEYLLVVTFTEAAAAEMKERIIDRINKMYREALECGDTVKSKYLKEQIQLAANADINTIDSFCLRAVKNSFYVLGIDPNFNIMDKSEGEMLADTVLSNLFLSLYSEEDSEEKARFTRLVSVFASNRDDEGLKKIVLKVYNFIQSFPSPIAWLKEKADMYSSDMAESIWIKDIICTQHKEMIIKNHEHFWNDIYFDMLNVVKTACNCDDDEAFLNADCYWGKLWRNVCMCREALEELKCADTLDSLYSFYKTYIEKKSLLGNAINSYPKKIDASNEVWQAYYNDYDYMRDELRSMCMKLPAQPSDEFNQYMHGEELKQCVEDLVWLVELFALEFDDTKSKKNEKTFSDVEHLTYKLFRENENIRREYAAKYEEILIDEYQDTNGLQDSIFTSISRDNKNMFMVGDLKQSIYAFRGGDPMIFKEKSRIYSKGEQGGTKISLSQNFRSRKNVLESINSVFEKVMSDEVGDVDYDHEEALKREEHRECYIDNVNLKNPTNISIGYNSELHRIAVIQDSEETEEGVTKTRAEAVCVADRIHDLIDGHFQVYDGDGKYRDIEYRDIVILMRSVRSSADDICEIFKSRNIPVFIQKDLYFERREINLMLTLISLINNHMQDIPLISVMRSPIGGFTENELAEIKIDYRGASFYKAVKTYKADCDDLTKKEKKLRDKCRGFIDDLDRWRGYVKMKSIASLIWTIYEETGFYDFMGALEGGEEAQANLKLLYERAKQYEETGFSGIFNFIRYIERMQNRSEDIGGAKLVNESHNVVKVMTIHKSKGLEFPVVFLMNTTKNIKKGNPFEEKRILMNKQLGFGMDYYNYEDMYRKKLIFNDYIKEQNEKESLSEEMRLLYVAMTRAKEKLIITSAEMYKNKNAYLDKLEEWKMMTSGGDLLSKRAKGAKTYSDWIIPAVACNGRCWNFFDKMVSSLDYDGYNKDCDDEIVIDNAEQMRKDIHRILEFKYAYPQSGAIPSKTSVTSIKEMEDAENKREDDPVYMSQKPEFMRGEKIGAEIGTAHHQIMAYINIEEMRKKDESDYDEFIAKEIERIVKDGQISADIVSDKKIMDMIYDNICGFFTGDMGREVIGARRVYREKPFEIQISACEYDPNLDEMYKDDKVVVQGIIDLYFEDKNGNLVLVDYKTDRCKTKEEQLAVAQRYKKQLELYGAAMEKILKKPVEDKYLYLFSSQSVVKLV